MKYINIIKLLSVLLCIGMLFVACDSSVQKDDAQTTGTTNEADTATDMESDSSAEDATEEITEEQLLENIEPDFKNFFELIEKNEESAISDAVRVDGDIISYDNSGRLFVLKTSDVDTKNTVTETFRLINTAIGEVTLTVENTYFNGDYDTFDWDDIMVGKNVTFILTDDGYVQQDSTVKYPENVMNVEVRSIGTVPYVVVMKAEITPIDDAATDADGEGCVYEIRTCYTYYDIYGTEFASSAEELFTVTYMSSDNVIATLFGSDIIYFDAETCKVIGSSSAVYDKISGVYDHENEAYGYYLEQSSNIAGLGSVKYFDVVDKATGEHAYRYYLSNNYEYTDTYVLHNGDILIQYENEVDEGDSFDYAIAPNEYWEIDHFIFSVKDGSVTEIDLPYYIYHMTDGESFCEEYSLEADGIKTSANARNIAYACYIGDGIFSITDIVIFDNDMSVLYVLDRVVPEHKIDVSGALGVTILSNGDYLVDLNDIVTDKAIVKPDGTVRTYLRSDMRVMGNFVVQGSDLYDYDLNHLYDLSEMSYNVVGELFGDLIVNDKDTEYASYYKITVDDDGEVGFTLLCDDNVDIIEIADEYVIVQREEDGKFALYNQDYVCVLVTYEPMNVFEFNGGYIVVTAIDGQYVLYELD